MKHVLLVLPPESDAPKSTSYALDEAARRGASLAAVALLDADLAGRVTSTLANVGFVGEKVCGSVSETLAREQRANAERVLERVGAESRARSIPFSAAIENGDLGDVVGRVSRERDVDLVVVAAERRSLLGRFLSRAAATRLPSLAGCEVKLIEE